MPKLIVKIQKNGEILVETVGMQGEECKPFVQRACEALNAIPLNLPESPQPLYHCDTVCDGDDGEAVIRQNYLYNEL